jgi:hypothetical protein
MKIIKGMMSVLNERIAPWIKWRTGLHTLVLKPVEYVPNTTTKKIKSWK